MKLKHFFSVHIADKLRKYIVLVVIISKEVFTKIVKYVTSWSELSCDVNTAGFMDYIVKMH